MKLFLSSLSLAALLIAGSVGFAQNLEREPLNVSGTVKGGVPGAVQVAVSEKEAWIIHIDESSIKPQDISFSATAEKTFLRPGMFLEFRAQVNKRGTVLEPVANLTVFTPSEARPPGVLPDGPAGGGGAGLFDEGKDKKKEEKKPDPKEKKAAKAKGDDTVYRIAGAVTKVGRAGDVTISAGGTLVKFNLAEDCKISVDLNDIAFVSPGDKVVVQGWNYKGQMGEGWASKIEVTATNPLSDGSKKKPVKPMKETKAAAKGAKGEKETKPDEKKEDGKEPKTGDKPAGKVKGDE